MAALKRLRMEFGKLTREPTEGIVAGPVSPENLLEWDCYIMGPPDTVYEYGFFHATLSFPADYPMSPVRLHSVQLSATGACTRPSHLRSTAEDGI